MLHCIVCGALPGTCQCTEAQQAERWAEIERVAEELAPLVVPILKLQVAMWLYALHQKFVESQQ